MVFPNIYLLLFPQSTSLLIDIPHTSNTFKQYFLRIKDMQLFLPEWATPGEKRKKYGKAKTLGAEAGILLDEDLVDGFLDAITMGGYFPIVLLFIFLLLIFSLYCFCLSLATSAQVNKFTCLFCILRLLVGHPRFMNLWYNYLNVLFILWTSPYVPPESMDMKTCRRHFFIILWFILK